MFASAAANNGVPYVCFLPMSREILALAEVCAPPVLSSILKPYNFDIVCLLVELNFWKKILMNFYEILGIRQGTALKILGMIWIEI